MKKVVFLLLAFSSIIVHAQKEASIWYFGFNAGLDFNSGTPVALTNGELSTREGGATMSDSNGNLLLYSDGMTVWNKNHQPMPNGTGLLGDTSTAQSGIIIPKPGEPNIYYVFSLDNEVGPNGLRYSVVDMNLDNGLGALTNEKNVLLYSSISERITAVMHSNGNAIWVITKAYDQNDFLSYLIDINGINTTPVVSSFPINGFYASIGTMKVSPDGKTLAATYTNDGKVELHHFDAGTGKVYDMVSLMGYFDTTYDTQQSYGCEFSSNGKVLYLTTRNGVYQFDISNFERNAIMSSGLLLSQEFRAPTFPFTTFPGALQMAIDGKIYCPLSGRKFLMIINNPNVLGPGCNFVENGVDLAGRQCFLGLPPFITSIFYVGIRATNFCLGTATQFNLDTGEPITAINWDFGDGNLSNLEEPSHIYATPGTYTVSVTVSTPTETKTETKEITIYDVPVANALVDYEVCSTNDNYEFDLTSKDSEVLGTQLPNSFGITYHATMDDAQNGINALPVLYTNSDPVESIYARIYNTNHPSCYDITDFELVVKDSPVLNHVADWTVCDTDSDGTYNFDLDLRDSEILGGQDAGKFTVSYYLMQSDAENNTNTIGSNYTNSASTEEIFFRVENRVHPECYVTGSFGLEVLDWVMANLVTAYEICDDDNDGVSQFDLSLKDLEILGSQNPTAISVTYYVNHADAENGINALNKNSYTNTIGYQETIFVRVENSSNPDCYDVSTLELIIHDSPLPQVVSDWVVCDMDNDDRYIFDLSEKDNEILGNQNATDFTVSYYESETDALGRLNEIVGPYENIFKPQTIYYRLENNGYKECSITGSFSIHVLDTPTAHPSTDIVVCDVNGTSSFSFDLYVQDPVVLNGQDPNLYEIAYFNNMADANTNLNKLPKTSYINTAPQETLFARIQTKSLEQCFDVVSFTLTLNPLPQPNLEEICVICPDSPDLILDGGDFETWEWLDDQGTILSTDRIFEILDLGDYQLKVSASTNGVSCENIMYFEVVSSGAPNDFTSVLNGFSDRVSLTIEATGIGEFEYSMDGENFQKDNTFEVYPGEYLVHVRDMFLCRTISKTIMVLGYQKFFMPNGDGTNEYWNVIGAEAYPNAVVHIYDRYGKLIKQLSPKGSGWDGVFQGKAMPSADYWFSYEYDNGKTYRGHFSLKR
ncbi:T9SS type B sorting domain-containing protein [Arenibacter sp. M-2]|uniref:T9SS type B sorting domain-containing protein n=1 Tax=Arenibacter sp. M-2 TaxID=3053612 RepID=UPI00256FBAEB|nr:T9SS type B sorting domain-containing protein [Arenibacter sp. M-2]MDL5514854.1 T9SS type B sorting domain-containing protein [Arenibacter sp. M-2]